MEAREYKRLCQENLHRRFRCRRGGNLALETKKEKVCRHIQWLARRLNGKVDSSDCFELYVAVLCQAVAEIGRPEHMADWSFFVDGRMAWWASQVRIDPSYLYELLEREELLPAAEGRQVMEWKSSLPRELETPSVMEQMLSRCELAIRVSDV